MIRALALLALAVLQLAAVPVRSHAPTGDVLGVSVVAAPGRAEVVVDLRGTVEVTDFVLDNPARLVLDLAGARLAAPALAYDGVNRAGIRNLRYSQFRPDVVRIVIELDEARDYRVTQESNAVRVAFEAAQSFAAWPAGAAPAAAAAPAARVAELPAAIARAAVPAPTVVPQASQLARGSWTFDNASIAEVVADFAAFSGRSIIIGREVTGTFTGEIRDQSWDVAFNAILTSQGLSATEMQGGIIRVDTRQNLAAADTTGPMETRTWRIRYARASALVPSLAPILTQPASAQGGRRGQAAADTSTNSLIVTDIATRMGAIDTFITQMLDLPPNQVAIQAKIIFVDRTDLENLGLRYDLGTVNQFYNRLIQRTDATTGEAYEPDVTQVDLGGNAVAAIANAQARFPAGGSPALELVYSTVIGNFALSAFLEALQSVTLADVQAEPQVTVLDNQRANIFVGQRTPIRVADPSSPATGPARVTVQFQQTGIRLDVTPHVVQGSREVLLELHAERSNIDVAPTADVGGIYGSQEGTTTVLVRDGQTAVIGGLTVTEVNVTKNGIPFLVDLPVIGRLFGFRTTEERRRDLLILVTPHIVDDISGPAAAPRP